MSAEGVIVEFTVLVVVAVVRSVASCDLDGVKSQCEKVLAMTAPPLYMGPASDYHDGFARYRTQDCMDDQSR